MPGDLLIEPQMTETNSMYPPAHHLNADPEDSFRVIEAFPFATLVSPADGDVQVSQVPLMLDRSRGELGYLVGHLDRNNPQVRCLDGGRVFVAFHGPNAYVSPSVYSTVQLPTWNSVSVHVRGTANVQKSLPDVRDSIVKMTSRLEQGNKAPYVLSRKNVAMAKLLKHVVGFEVMIESVLGRFKLSQDKPAIDRELAMNHLLSRQRSRQEQLIRSLV